MNQETYWLWSCALCDPTPRKVTKRQITKEEYDAHAEACRIVNERMEKRNKGIRPEEL